MALGGCVLLDSGRLQFELLESRKSLSGEAQAQMSEKVDNSFNQLRLILALVVLIGHGIWVLGSGKESVISIGKIPISYVAVYCFFAISGYLVAPKLAQNGVRSFFMRRSARIYPAYAGVIVLTALLFSTIWQAQKNVIEFGIKDQMKYLILNLIPFPGVFSQGFIPINFLAGQPRGVLLNGIINVPLWTLTWECIAYITLIILFMIATHWKRNTSKFFLYTMSVIYILSILWASRDFPIQSYHTNILESLMQKWPYFLFFFSGAVASTSISYYKIPKKLTILSLMLFIVSTNSTTMLAVFGVFAMTHVVLVIGESKLLTLIPIKVDMSYGVYLYHFPVMQTISHYPFFHARPLYFLICTIFFTVIFAYISAKFLEEPILRKARTRY